MSIVVKADFKDVLRDCNELNLSHAQIIESPCWDLCESYGLDFDSAAKIFMKKSFLHRFRWDIQKLAVLLDYESDVPFSDFKVSELFRLRGADGYRYYSHYENAIYNQPWLGVVSVLRTDLNGKVLSFEFAYMHMKDHNIYLLNQLRITVFDVHLSVDEFIKVAQCHSMPIKKLYTQSDEVVLESVQTFKLINY